MRESSLTLVVETPQGTLIRRVPDATPLPSSGIQGYAAEDATCSAAALWGLPDFVFRSEQQRSGSGIRELGDGLVLVGNRGMVLQVKSRTNATDDESKEVRWLAKNIDKAIRQAGGTIRRLPAQPAVLTNARGRALNVDASKFDWLSVVVIDHPAPPADFAPPSAPGVVVVLRRDWEFLFDHLRSTRAVVAYLARVAGEPLELGREPSRYHEYALADLNADPDPLAEQLTFVTGVAVSTAKAPLQPAGHEDMPAHMLLRTIMEDIANIPMPPDSGEADKLRMLADLDGLPVEARTELGHTLRVIHDSRN